ncbi:class GN sortase [Microbulbifer sp. OS29]|uniref:Class GN sortase n=1 Tax=Microbulbifer okhotskensis TaxID=2926617 RepID=A0A9X2EQC4_9GAMM|nr:class GN sortase [Microbulbifer okhotskensis]MCO1333666.1 class GN sortase [Microbulbifer okhotskensis]
MIRSLLFLLCLGTGVWQLGSAAWLLAKAELAQLLIANAWEGQLQGEGAQKPWPWADTWPVAKLKLQGQAPQFVLAGGSGQALAFGPGLLAGSGDPGGDRTTVIAAHRDTHFSGLQYLKYGAVIYLQDSNGHWHSYRVVETRIVDSEREMLPIFAERGLLLVTCYPFAALTAGGPLRYLVYAEYQSGGERVQL